MTREERTSALANLRHVKRWNDKAGLADETIDTCIKALEQEPCEDLHEIPSNEMNLEQARQAVRDLRKCVLDNYLLSGSGDAVSRQAVLNEFENDQYHLEFCIEHGIDRSISMEMVRIRLHDMPPVTPQPKTGHWLRMSDLSEQEDDRYRCSRCGNVVHHTNKMNLYTFNSWCGRCGSDNGRHINYDVEANYFEEPQEESEE